MIKNLQITIYGKVQGVFFRASTKAVADTLGIKGFVLNKPEGTVYAEAEGDEFSLEEFLKFCRKGPKLARVEKVETHEGRLKNYRNFEVIKKISQT